MAASDGGLGLTMLGSGHGSDIRLYLEGGAESSVYCLAGDSAYSILPVLVKPNSTREALNNALMQLFFLPSPTKMNQNVFARWKGSFLICRMLRAQYNLAKLIIMATAILNNIAMKFEGGGARGEQ